MSIVPSRRILVVDDSRAARVEAAKLIEPYGFDVDLAEDGAAALRRLEERSAYDLVLLDLRMPALDGHELLRVMRARSNFTPVVVVTAGMETRLVTATLRLGATDFLLKPLEAGAVRVALARAMNVPPDLLRPETPRVLVVGREACVAALRSALPAHVEVDRVEPPELGRAVEERPYRLVVLDLRDRFAGPDPVAAAEAAEREETACAAAVFRTQPGAAVCRVAPTGRAAPGLDASVALEDLAAATEASLYPNAVRPLVLHDDASVVVAGFRGSPTTEASYFAIAERRLRLAVTLMAAAGKSGITVDLSRLPAQSSAIERLAAAAAAAMSGHVTGARLLVAPVFVAPISRLGLPLTVAAPDWKAGPRAVFRWTSDLAVGVEAIDRQHQELFDRVNALLTAAGTGLEHAVVLESVRFLAQYTQEHFTDEEALMARAAYPGLGEHRAQHEAFRERVRRLVEEVERSGSTPELRARLERDVCEWLYRHVQKVDRALGPALSRL